MTPSICRWPNGSPIRWPNGGPRDPVRALLRGCWQVQQRPAPSVPSHPVAGLLRGCWQLQRPPPSVSFGSIQTSFGTKRQHPAEAAEVRFLRGARSQHPEPTSPAAAAIKERIRKRYEREAASSASFGPPGRTQSPAAAASSASLLPRPCELCHSMPWQCVCLNVPRTVEEERSAYQIASRIAGIWGDTEVIDQEASEFVAREESPEPV